MDPHDFFKKIPVLPADRVRELLHSHDPDAYNLVDVRQPAEYAQGHLPGARLIPMGELADRLKELDPRKPTIVY